MSLKLEYYGTTWVGVTKALFLNFSVTRNFHFEKVYVGYSELRSYLPGVSAAKLR